LWPREQVFQPLTGLVVVAAMALGCRPCDHAAMRASLRLPTVLTFVVLGGCGGSDGGRKLVVDAGADAGDCENFCLPLPGSDAGTCPLCASPTGECPPGCYPDTPE
jgi:hypothetical protein